MLVLGAVLLAACAGPFAPPVALSGNRDELMLRAEMHATGNSLVIETVVRNDRAEPIHLVPDQCGRVTEALLVRTRFAPEGAMWGGSVQAVKELILDDQMSRQRPDRFHPRIPGDRSSRVPECARPELPIRLEPGQEIAERWELPLTSSLALSALGSEATALRLEVVEASAPDEPEFLDIYQAGSADEARAGRNLRVEQPTSTLLSLAPSAPESGPSLGQLFDRLLANGELRRWIEDQPGDSWMLATLTPAFPEYGDPDLEKVRLTLVTTEFERPAHVIAEADGADATAELPGPEARARTFTRRPGTTPPGVALIPEPEGYTLSDDLLLGEVLLPSGRVVVGEYLLDEGLSFEGTVPPGRYPVHATLARYRDQDFDSVALASMVLSDEPIVRWEEASVIGVDGGSTSITSAEAAQAMGHAFDRDEDEWLSFNDVMFYSLAAHDHLATEIAVEGQLNLAHFSSGVGDGGYPVFVGYDAAEEPARIVVDFLLLHLGWPSGD